MAGCNGQHASRLSAKASTPIAGRRAAIDRAMVLASTRLDFGRAFVSTARPISSTTSSLAATNGISA